MNVVKMFEKIVEKQVQVVTFDENIIDAGCLLNNDQLKQFGLDKDEQLHEIIIQPNKSDAPIKMHDKLALGKQIPEYMSLVYCCERSIRDRMFLVMVNEKAVDPNHDPVAEEMLLDELLEDFNFLPKVAKAAGIEIEFSKNYGRLGNMTNGEFLEALAISAKKKLDSVGAQSKYSTSTIV